MAPYVALTGSTLRTKGSLTESGYRRNARKVHRHTARLLGSDRPAALCTHRPVLVEVFAALLEGAAPEVGNNLPPTARSLAPGEVVVAHVLHAPGRPAQALEVERYVASR
jgi:8-oxo-dGTP diphosphatase